MLATYMPVMAESRVPFSLSQRGTSTKKPSMVHSEQTTRAKVFMFVIIFRFAEPEPHWSHFLPVAGATETGWLRLQLKRDTGSHRVYREDIFSSVKI